MYDAIVNEAVMGARSLPVCPACGPITREVQAPDLLNGASATKARVVRVPCPHQIEQAEAKEQEVLRKDRHINFSQAFRRVLPPRSYTGASLEGLEDRAGSRDGRRVAGRYVASWDARRAAGDGLIFSGPTGTGKTLVAACIANALDARYASVVFLTVIDLQARLRDFDHAREFVEACRRADLLVLDDMGAERATEWAVSELFAVIDARYRDRLPLVITTNLSAPDLTAHYMRCLTQGKDKMPADAASLTIQRVLSRLRERCAGVRFDGPDQRETTQHTWLTEETSGLERKDDR